MVLRGDRIYPLLTELRENRGLSFIQIHSHVHRDMLFFSPIDERNNAFNVDDIREFNPEAQFFRILHTPGASLAEYFDYDGRAFRNLEVMIT